MRMIAHGFEAFLQTDRTEHRAIRSLRSFGHRILQPQLDRIHAQLLRQFIDRRFEGECRGRRTRGAIGGDLGLVDDDIIGLDEEIRDGVGRLHAHGAGAERRAGISAAFVDQLRAGGDHGAVALRAELHIGLDARGRTRSAQHFLARHDHLDRQIGLARQGHGQRLEIEGGLAAEAAADFAGDDLDAADLHAEDGGGSGAHLERALGRAPDQHMAIGVVPRHAGVRFDVSLMDHAGLVGALDDDVGLGKALGHVAARQLITRRHVGRIERSGLLLVLGAQIIVQNGRAGLHGFFDIENDRQLFVDHLDALGCFAGHIDRGCRHRRHRVAVIEHFRARHDVVAQRAHVAGTLAHRHLRAALDDVGAGDDGLHAGHGRGFAGIDGDDARVAMRAAQHHAVDHPRQREIGAVVGAAGHLVQTVGADGTRAHHLELALCAGFRLG